MFSLFNQPYPTDDRPTSQVRKAVLIGLFVGLFLLVFQPFGLNLWETPNKIVKILGFGVVSFVVTALYFIIVRRLFPQAFAEERWTVGREILAIMVNILLISIANRLYLNWLLSSGESSGLSWFGMILVTFLVGLFPVVGLVLFSYITQLKRYSQAAAELPVHSPVPTIVPAKSDVISLSDSPTDTNPDTTLTLIADNEKDTLTIKSKDLLFIESSDNYCTVVHLKNGQPVKPLLRSSLSRLEKQILLPSVVRIPFVRCHRSYVVNLDRVERVTGNAQGYKLHLLGGQFQIPVARQYNETLVAELKAL
ncbi:LytR/AlgR family response regulator transcription factor [Spirosoma endophyticum]|uniref:Transcriptional regulator, LytTR family n=1 Tax=Spirosoma endophyticum TaxID=662367 RepID=A0A1I1T5H0_9BACT|nr:LytTR family DNA-binding domain-containing protein [Spirosoma endophyticum]SFD51523.1 transcriptional regulator, LytTR family [Spirosoma endophyticum]